MASDRMRKKIKDYAEIFGHIMRKHALIMRKRVSSWDFAATFGKINKAIKNYFVSRHEFCFKLEIMEQNCNTFGARSIPSIIAGIRIRTWSDDLKRYVWRF